MAVFPATPVTDHRASVTAVSQLSAWGECGPVRLHNSSRRASFTDHVLGLICLYFASSIQSSLHPCSQSLFSLCFKQISILNAGNFTGDTNPFTNKTISSLFYIDLANSIRAVQMERSWSRIMFSVSEKMHAYTQRAKKESPLLALTHTRTRRA